jgi:hypothetical protein
MAAFLEQADLRGQCQASFSSFTPVLCLIDLKLARLARPPKHLDSQVDVAGYAAVLREVSR